MRLTKQTGLLYVSGLTVVFDTCWRDSVLRIYYFRIKPGRSELIL